MEAAAGEMKFERAAGLRDQIQALNTVRERQKIISTEEADQDVVGVVRQGADACVQLFFVRKGRLMGRESFFFDRVSGSEQRRDPLGLPAPVLRPRRDAAARDPALGGAARIRAHRGVARPAPRRPRRAHRPPARQEARAGRHGRGQRRARARDARARPRAIACRSCWTSWRARSTCPGRPTASRASTSPPSRGARRWPPWWSGRMAT